MDAPRNPVAEEELHVLYREWGTFYTHKQKLDVAALYYNKSLDIRQDSMAFYNRSRCKRNIAETADALKDAKAAATKNPSCQPYRLEVCTGMYQLNQFEKAMIEASVSSRKFTGTKRDAFDKLNEVLIENFESTVGPNLGLFILEHENYFHKAFDKMRDEANVDPKPLWKKMKERKMCDVLSVLEVEKELISPREIARRRRSFNVFNQLYMRRSWIDVLFLRALKSDPNLMLSQSQWSRPHLETITNSRYNAAMQFLRMLHVRSPMYTEKFRKFPNAKVAKKNTEDFLYRVQYQVHRNMLMFLHKMKTLRKQRRLEELTKYVEGVMGEYVVLKTRRVMPWRFQFINEVYNLLALAHIDRYTSIPKDLMLYPISERLNVLLRVKSMKEKEAIVFIFGDRSTYQDADEDDLDAIKCKAFTARMEKRLLFAKHPIERTYILHEMARNHLYGGLFDESISVAQKCIVEAKKVNANVWTILAMLVMCQAATFLGKTEMIKATLNDAKKASKKLTSPILEAYINCLIDTNELHYQERKQAETLRQGRSRTSMHKTSSEYTVN